MCTSTSILRFWWQECLIDMDRICSCLCHCILHLYLGLFLCNVSLPYRLLSGRTVVSFTPITYLKTLNSESQWQELSTYPSSTVKVRHLKLGCRLSPERNGCSTEKEKKTWTLSANVGFHALLSYIRPVACLIHYVKWTCGLLCVLHLYLLGLTLSLSWGEFCLHTLLIPWQTHFLLMDYKWAINYATHFLLCLELKGSFLRLWNG